MLKTQMAPAHSHPIPAILAKLQFAYTAMRVANNWAIRKAATSKKPGHSTKDQLRDLVTKMRAWLTILT